MCYLFFREYRTKCAITCFAFWESIAQNVLLRVLCFGEVSHKMCCSVYCVWGKYRTKCAITHFVFGGSIAQMQKIFRVPRRYHKNVGYVYWYSTAQMWRISSAPTKLKYNTCLVFLGSIAKI